MNVKLKGPGLQDGMLSHYLSEVAMSDSTIEERLKAFEWNTKGLASTELDELYASTRHFRRLKRFLAARI